MSHFYGSIPTSARKTVPTARAHKSTGLTVHAASWAGAISTTLWCDSEGRDRYTVLAVPHHGVGASRVLASGFVGEGNPGVVGLD